MLLTHPQLGVNAQHIVIALSYLTLVCNLISVLVEVVNFAMFKVDNFCNKKIVAVYFKLFDKKYARIVVSESERERICLFGCSMISLQQWAKRLFFDFADPISTLGFGRGICIHLLAWSKILRKSVSLLTKEVSCLLEIFNSSWMIESCCVFKSQKWNNLIANVFCWSLS